MTRPVQVIWIILATCGVVSCSADISDLRRWLAAHAAGRDRVSPGAAASAAGFPHPVMPVWSGRDPFAPGRGPAAAASPRHRQPLEVFALDSLTMVGTLRRSGRTARTALVRDPSGTVHMLDVHDYAGRHRGRVIAVGAGHIELVERWPDGAGGWRVRRTRIALDHHASSGG